MEDMSDTEGVSRRQMLAGLGAGLLAAGTGVGQASADNHEVTIVLDNEGSSAWTIDLADEDVGPTGVSNPELSLVVGTRYRVENLGWSFHPLAFRGADGTALLTQDGQGTFEDDAAVDWTDDGDELAFTLTEDLAAELDSYICTVHSAMEGGVETVEDADEDGDDADDDGPGFGPLAALAGVGGAAYAARRLSDDRASGRVDTH